MFLKNELKKWKDEIKADFYDEVSAMFMSRAEELRNDPSATAAADPPSKPPDEPVNS